MLVHVEEEVLEAVEGGAQDIFEGQRAWRPDTRRRDVCVVQEGDNAGHCARVVERVHESRMARINGKVVGRRAARVLPTGERCSGAFEDDHVARMPP